MDSSRKSTVLCVLVTSLILLYSLTAAETTEKSKSQDNSLIESGSTGRSCKNDSDCPVSAACDVKYCPVAYCNNSECMCIGYLTPNTGVCYPQSDYGLWCEYDGQCRMTDEHLICFLNICRCDLFYIYEDDHCEYNWSTPNGETTSSQ